MFAIDDEDVRHWHSRRDRHLFDNIAQDLFLGILGVDLDQSPAEHLRNGAATCSQLRRLEHHRAADHDDDECRDRAEHRPVDQIPFALGIVTDFRRDQRHLCGEVDQHDDADDGCGKKPNESARCFASLILMSEEIHSLLIRLRVRRVRHRRAGYRRPRHRSPESVCQDVRGRTRRAASAHPRP